YKRNSRRLLRRPDGRRIDSRDHRRDGEADDRSRAGRHAALSSHPGGNLDLSGGGIGGEDPTRRSNGVMEWWSLWLCDRRRTETIFSQSTIHYSNAPRLTQLHRLAAFDRLVDRHQNPDVAQPL